MARVARRRLAFALAPVQRVAPTTLRHDVDWVAPPTFSSSEAAVVLGRAPASRVVRAVLGDRASEGDTPTMAMPVAVGVRVDAGRDAEDPSPIQASSRPQHTAVGSFVETAVAPDLTFALACGDSMWSHRLLKLAFGEPSVLAYISRNRAIVGFTVVVNGVKHLFVSFRIVAVDQATSHHLNLRELVRVVQNGDVVFVCSCFQRFVETELENRVNGRRLATFVQTD
jgi:hypothetical protein